MTDYDAKRARRCHAARLQRDRQLEWLRLAQQFTRDWREQEALADSVGELTEDEAEQVELAGELDELLSERDRQP